MSVKDYSLKLIQLSKSAPTIEVDLRDEMSKFLIGVSDLVVKKCRSAMHNYDMDISRLTMYTQQIE